jgi:hypothetical protein
MTASIKKKRRTLSIGEIARRGLLKTRDGVAVSNKGSVSRMLRDFEYETVDTPHGPAKMYTLDVIVKANLSRTK